MLRSKPKAKTINEIFKKMRVKLKKDSIECLLNMYIKACTASSPSKSKASEKLRMDRHKFRGILQDEFHMTDDILMDRVFRAFDTDGDGNISEEEWVIGFSIILLKDSELNDEKIKFVFRAYDLKEDGQITRECMFTFLKDACVKQPQEEDPDESTRELVELVMKKMDKSKSQRVSLNDFIACVKENSLMLHSLGTCGPENSKDIDAFCKKISSGSSPFCDKVPSKHN